MHTHRETVGFITILVTACCLALGGFPSSAAAKTIVVTTDQDVVDPPFDPTGLCGTGTIADLPGADGFISLREAVIAANNTPGAKTIRFASILSGSTIVLTRSLALCGGHTTLNGDVDGNDTPDITLDGTAVLFPFDVIDVFSSHNTVKSLHVLASFVHVVGAIAVVPTPAVATTVVDNTLAHNIVTGGTIFVGAGFDYSTNGQSFNGATVKHITVRDNTVVNAPGAGIDVFLVGDHHKMTDVTIARNTVSGTTGTGIAALGGAFNDADPTDDGASDNRLTVMIKDNLVTGSNGVGIFASAGVNNSSHNRVEVTIRGNTLENNSSPGDTAGISIVGGFFSSSHNQVIAAIFDNTITANNGNGMTVGAGLDNSSQNQVEVKIRGNMLENNAGVGILTYSAIGVAFSPSGESSGNRLDARIERNTVQNAFLFGLWINGGIGGFDGALDKVANNNEVKAVVKDNTVIGTTGEGVHLEAGGSGAANDNDLDVTVRKNTVCGSTNADIHAIGGLLGNPFLPDNTGAGNVLEGEISKNTASTVVIEDGVAGNSATVTQFNNNPCPAP
jgi:hypothetical protein